MEIRKACMDDLFEIAEIEAACFPASEAAGIESIRSRLSVFPQHFYLLCEEDRIISFVNGMVTDEEHLTDEMYDHASMHREEGAWQMIFGVDTRPEYQHQGYASKALSYAIDCARGEKRKGLVLTCKERLIGFYERFGFVNEGVSASLHGNVVWYEMRLTF